MSTWSRRSSSCSTGEATRRRPRSSAEEALERFRADTFHLVLTDLLLPGATASRSSRRSTRRAPTTKTVLITGHGSIRSAVSALKRGAVDYMRKPVKPQAAARR